jgi:carbon-monoxide dehydrogenase large subunit/6-hydroxypseudooxynicotine dehydrogenase subunit gamma
MSGTIGKRVRRKEDPRLLRGDGRYIADWAVPGMLHAAILRSTHAHARIAKLDLDAVRSAPGVVGVLAPEDVAHMERIPVRVQLEPLPSLLPHLQTHLAQEKVRYVGEPIAVVAAVDRYAAEDALELAEVEYEPLPAVTSVEAAVEPDAPLLVEETGTNIAAELGADVGDVDRAFRDAALVVSDVFKTNRHGGVPMETRGVLAAYDPHDGRLTVWGPTKVPHSNRNLLARFLGISEDRIRFVEPDVGGGFGARGEFYPEDLLIPYLALRLRRPVKWIEDRREHLLATNHSRDQWYSAELALAADGTFLGLRARMLHNTGAYVRTHGIRVAELSVNSFQGPYKIPNYRIEVASVVTNVTPGGTYRSPGRYEATFVRERLVELAADELGVDSAELRRRNFVRADEMPYEPGPMNLDEPVTFDSGDPPAIFERALQLIGYDEFRERQARARAEGRRLGIGLSCYMEESGLGGPGNTPGEYARVVVGNSGDVTLYSGVAVLGQGLETVLAQVVAEELDVSYEDVAVVHGDTDRVPWGGGTWADRGAIIGGNAALDAARSAKEKLRDVGARLLEASVEDVEVAGGVVRAKDDPSRSVAWGDIARATYNKRFLREGVEPGVEGTSVFVAQRMCHAPGTEAAIVEVDEETGLAEILEHVVVYDIGRALNLTIVEGQAAGGVVQGIGGAFLEHFAYDETGQPLASTFMDYLLPTALEAPRERVIEIREDHPSPLNPLGLKGGGEVGPGAAAALYANAICDAFRDRGLKLTRLPLSPDSVRAALVQATPFVVTR